MIELAGLYYHALVRSEIDESRFFSVNLVEIEWDKDKKRNEKIIKFFDKNWKKIEKIKDKRIKTFDDVVKKIKDENKELIVTKTYAEIIKKLNQESDKTTQAMQKTLQLGLRDYVITLYKLWTKQLKSEKSFDFKDSNIDQEEFSMATDQIIHDLIAESMKDVILDAELRIRTKVSKWLMPEEKWGD